jgi:hypothetical protein
MTFSNLNPPGIADNWQATFQGQHVIPENVYSQFPFLQHLNQLKDSEDIPLFNIDDFSTNGIYLPSNDKDAMDAGLSKHLGSHPEYDKEVPVDVGSGLPPSAQTSRSIMSLSVLGA